MKKDKWEILLLCKLQNQGSHFKQRINVGCKLAWKMVKSAMQILIKIRILSESAKMLPLSEKLNPWGILKKVIITWQYIRGKKKKKEANVSKQDRVITDCGKLDERKEDIEK